MRPHGRIRIELIDEQRRRAERRRRRPSSLYRSLGRSRVPLIMAHYQSRKLKSGEGVIGAWMGLRHSHGCGWPNPGHSG